MRIAYCEAPASIDFGSALPRSRHRLGQVDRVPTPDSLPGDITIWKLNQPSESASADLDSTLSQADWAEIDALRDGARRRRARVVRGFLRGALSAVVGGAVEPSAWRFERNAYGRPHVATGFPPVDFNISHADRATCIAIAKSGRVGLDIADRCVPNWHEIARELLTPAERNMLNRARGEHGEHAFLRIWTAKEAFAKLLGIGLALDAPADECAAGTHLASWSHTSPSGELFISVAVDTSAPRTTLPRG